MVPPDIQKYKADATDDPLRLAPAGNGSQSLLRSGHIKQQPESPHQTGTPIPSGAYATTPASHAIPLQHHLPYVTSHTPDHSYYPNPYPATSTAPGGYHSSGQPDLIAAAAQMHRPSYPPVYPTPQSNSPGSIASPQGHDPHGRNMYVQSPQMPAQMYGYPPYSPVNPVHAPPYPQHPPNQQHPLSSQPMIMHPQAAPIQHPPPSLPGTTMSSSPRIKFEPNTNLQGRAALPQSRSSLAPSHPAPTQIAPNDSHANQNTGANPNAAPGPIPATTPLVVRQDSNGVQWIAFEYSRERVKMEYTIRCDVESVNVDNLKPEFKAENCVYPRACCGKDQYRGNRLQYETECNTVGWALAELNPPLRGKRGLIQRAVDSWRNSNQDPRYRSRRVRRMAKLNRRQTSQPATPSVGGSSAGVPHSLPSTPGMAASGARPTNPLPMSSTPIQHHLGHPDGTPASTLGAPGDYINGAHRPPGLPNTPHQAGQHTPDLRTGHVFHGYSAYPPAASASDHRGAPSIPPSLQGSAFDSLGRHPTVATSQSDRHEELEEISSGRKADQSEIYGDLPESKRRKFILVDDNQRGCRVRVKVMLDQVDTEEIPDSYRLSSAVYPRTYFPVQMKSPPGRVVPGQRFFDNDDDDGENATVSRTLVPAPSIDGEGSIAVPKLSRSQNKKERILNDLGYRMSWSQSRVFAGRPLFLQRSLDAYRNKIRSTILTTGQDTTSIAPHFETRAGKRKWLDRDRKNMVPRSAISDGKLTAPSLSTSQRSAEEVES